ncbi:muts domain V-domain-containing protein [Gorgonomyces haynaldii]|nr:muts domain V-domain-containing protein [Gorgonomyces haynaldii]
MFKRFSSVLSFVKQATPLKRQVDRFQQEHPRHILLVQVGSFYEIYDTGGYLDKISGLLGLRIAQHKQGKRQSDRFLRFAGFPVQSLQDHVKMLLHHGHTVAIVNQTGKDRMTGSIQRQVTRIVTPGTVLEPNELETSDNNFLGSIFETDGSLGIAWADVTTGDFFMQQSSPEMLETDLHRIQPKELLVPQDLRLDLQRTDNITITVQERSKFQCPVSAQKLSALVHRRLKPSDYQSKRGSTLAAAVGLVGYISETFPEFRPSLSEPVSVDPSQSIVMDPNCIQSLELVQSITQKTRKGSLLSIIDKTRTAGGSRLLVSRLKSPSTSMEQINTWHDHTSLFYKNQQLLHQISSLLSEIRDIERALQRLHTKSGGIPEFQQIVHSLVKAREIQDLLVETPFHSMFDGLDFSELLLYEQWFEDTEGQWSVTKGIDDTLDQMRAHLKTLEAKKQVLGEQLSQELGMHTVLTDDPLEGPLLHLKATATQKKSLESRIDPKTTVIVNTRKQKTATVLRDQRWSDLHNEMRLLMDKIQHRDNHLFQQACTHVLDRSLFLIQLCRVLAEIDVSCSFASVSLKYGYTRPEMTQDLVHEIVGGRHPVVEYYQNQRNQTFVINDSHLNQNERVCLLTGPNMGGKSTYLRQCALISIMAQSGCFVPAVKARLGILKSIYTRIGAADDLAQHQSTFMVEMSETAKILNNCDERSLVIMDEVGRGTSNKDGISLALAIVEHLLKQKSLVFFATHYHELVPMIQKEGICFYQAKMSEDQTCLFKIEPGVMDQSFGIRVAQMAGLPESVIDRARKVFDQMR